MKVAALLVILSSAGVLLTTAGDNAVISLRPVNVLNLNPWKTENTFANGVTTSMAKRIFQD